MPAARGSTHRGSRYAFLRADQRDPFGRSISAAALLPVAIDHLIAKPLVGPTCPVSIEIGAGGPGSCVAVVVAHEYYGHLVRSRWIAIVVVIFASVSCSHLSTGRPHGDPNSGNGSAAAAKRGLTLDDARRLGAKSRKEAALIMMASLTCMLVVSGTGPDADTWKFRRALKQLQTHKDQIARIVASRESDHRILGRFPPVSQMTNRQRKMVEIGCREGVSEMIENLKGRFD